MPDDELESEWRATERLTFFSDAVVAIAVTLLAIELPVPEGDSVAEFWLSVRHDAGHYAAFLISFAAIAAAWSNHYDLFRYARRVDGRLRTMNLGWLLVIVLNPFATKLLTTNGEQALDTHAWRFGFYALLQVLESGVLFAMMRHMIAYRQAPDIPAPVVTDMAWQSYALMLGFGLSIPVFFVTTYGWVLWIAIPLLVARLRQLRRRNGSPEVT
jgi:uncharacterized membrane protein